MKTHVCATARGVPMLITLLLLAAASEGLRPAPNDVKEVDGGEKTPTILNGSSSGDDLLKQVYHPTSSSLPDCSHACGACSPCSRVMVSFKCSVAESCPMVYRCMCKGKCYPVPSS